MVPPDFLAVVASLDLTRGFTVPVRGEGPDLSWTLSYSTWKCASWIKVEMCWDPKRCWGNSDRGVYFNSKCYRESHLFFSLTLLLRIWTLEEMRALPMCLCSASPPALGLAPLAGVKVNLGHTLFIYCTWQIVRPKPVLPLGTSVLCWVFLPCRALQVCWTWPSLGECIIFLSTETLFCAWQWHSCPHADPTTAILPVYQMPRKPVLHSIKTAKHIWLTRSQAAEMACDCLFVEPTSTPWHPRLKSSQQKLLQISHLVLSALWTKLFLEHLVHYHNHGWRAAPWDNFMMAPCCW